MAAARDVTPQKVWDGLRLDWWRGEGFDSAQPPGEIWRAAVRARSQRLRLLAQGGEGNVSAEELVLALDESVGCLVLIAETEPGDFLAGFLAALLAGWDVALANPNWGAQEWDAVRRLLSPQVIWGQDIPLRAQKKSVSKASDASEPMILIPTGGSSGQVKFVRHSWQSLTASALGFLHYFSPNADPINTYCILPLYHVSGLMQVLRAWLSNGQITLTSFKTLKNLFPPSLPSPLPLLSPSPPLPPPPPQTHISLVPTQLQYLLQSNAAPWLRQFSAVLLGGAPAWPTLLTRAAQAQIPLCLSYGMTETAAMVTLLPSPDFCDCDSTQESGSSGQPLPHAAIEILHEGQQLPPGEIGQVVVRSPAVAQGYYNLLSTAFHQNAFHTDDLGYLSADRHLHIVGRASCKIISGGENIFPAEVEAAIRSTQQVKDVCVVGVSDDYWGEVVVAAYVPNGSEVSTQSLQQALLTTNHQNTSQPQLSRYKHPKHWIALKGLPRNAQGKLNHQLLLAQLKDRQVPQSSVPALPLVADDGAGSR